MPENLEITYRATGGRIPVDLDLHLQPDGQVELYVGSSYSIPVERVSRVGSFGGAAPQAEVAAIRDYLDQHDLLSSGGTSGQASPDIPNRSLTIEYGERKAQFILSGMNTNPELDAFEQLLQRLALALTRQPLRAVEADLKLSRDQGQIASTIVLRSIGSQPMTVLLVDPGQPTNVLRASVTLEGKMALPSGASMPMGLGTTNLAPSSVQELAQKGDIPAGVTELPAGATYQFALPPLKAPQATVPVSGTGTLLFWLPDGQARRGMTLVTPEVPLP